MKHRRRPAAWVVTATRMVVQQSGRRPAHRKTGRRAIQLKTSAAEPSDADARPVADLADDAWKAARAAVCARKRFFEDLRAITTYLVLPNWAAILETLRSGKATAVGIRDG